MNWKDDKLMPVASSVLYWGTKWDGPRELYDMLDFGDGREAEALKEYVPNYKIKVVSMAEFENPDVFRSCLQHIFRMVQCKEDRKQLEEYMNVHKDEFQQMDSVEKEAVVMILGEGTKVARQFEKAVEEGRVEEFDMCGAFKQMIEDGKVEGKIESKIELVCKKLQKNKTVEVIADEMEEDIAFIEKIVNFVEAFAPEYNVEKILEAWIEQNPVR